MMVRQGFMHTRSNRKLTFFIKRYVNVEYQKLTQITNIYVWFEAFTATNINNIFKIFNSVILATQACWFCKHLSKKQY
jgi:uncharacterized protein YegL